MAVSSVSNEQWVDFFQTAGQISAVGGGVTSLACILLGKDYTYPCTVTALGACLWVSIWLAQSAKKEALDPKNMKERFKEQVHKSIDTLGLRIKERIKGTRDQVVDMGVSAAKAAVLTSLPSGAGVCAGSLITRATDSSKGISDKGIDYSVDSMGKTAKKCVNRSFNNSSEGKLYSCN